MTAVEEYEIEPLLSSGAGHGVTFMREIEPAADVTDRLIDETIAGTRRASSIQIDD